jgi:hypothetical protein
MPTRQPQSDASPPCHCLRAPHRRRGPKPRATAAARARRLSPHRRATTLTLFCRRVLQLSAASPLLHLLMQFATEPRVSERRRRGPSTISTPPPSRRCRRGPFPLCHIIASPSACRSHTGVLKTTIDLSLEPVPRHGRHARANVVCARAPRDGRGVGCLPAPAACSWVVPDMAVGCTPRWNGPCQHCAGRT